MGRAGAAVSIGVVGVGFGQQVLVPALRRDERCEVVAICATDRERAQRAADRLGVPTAYGQWERLVEDSRIDAVALAIPPAVQPDVAIAAARHGKHLFCEKPLAPTRERAADMVRAAKAAGVAHVVDFELPMLETWRQAKRILEARALGQIRHALVTWQVETYTNRLGLSSWKIRPEEGGGTLNVFVSHTVSYVEWLLGPLRRLWARLFPSGWRSSEGRGDLLDVLCLELADGTPVSVSVSSNAAMGTGHRVEVYGAEGSLVLENPTSDYAKGFRLLQRTRNGDAQVIAAEPDDPSGVDGRIIPVSRVVNRFLDRIEGRPSDAPTLDEGYRVQCWLEAARLSDKTGTWVELSDVMPATSQAMAETIPPSVGAGRRTRT